MKRKILGLAMAAALLAFGMILTGCGNSCDNDGNCEVGVRGGFPVAPNTCTNSSCIVLNQAEVSAAITGGRVLSCDC